MLEIKNLEKYFGEKKVLKGINVKINDGELVGIIGPSGCGKSTFLRSINFLEKPTKGQIILDGDDLVHRSLFLVYLDHLLVFHIEMLQYIQLLVDITLK